MLFKIVTKRMRRNYRLVIITIMTIALIFSISLGMDIYMRDYQQIKTNRIVGDIQIDGSFDYTLYYPNGSDYIRNNVSLWDPSAKLMDLWAGNLYDLYVNSSDIGWQEVYFKNCTENAVHFDVLGIFGIQNDFIMGERLSQFYELYNVSDDILKDPSLIETGEYVFINGQFINEKNYEVGDSLCLGKLLLNGDEDYYSENDNVVFGGSLGNGLNDTFSYIMKSGLKIGGYFKIKDYSLFEHLIHYSYYGYSADIPAILTTNNLAREIKKYFSISPDWEDNVGIKVIYHDNYTYLLNKDYNEIYQSHLELKNLLYSSDQIATYYDFIISILQDIIPVIESQRKETLKAEIPIIVILLLTIFNIYKYIYDKESVSNNLMRLKGLKGKGLRKILLLELILPVLIGLLGGGLIAIIVYLSVRKDLISHLMDISEVEILQIHPKVLFPLDQYLVYFLLIPLLSILLLYKKINDLLYIGSMKKNNEHSIIIGRLSAENSIRIKIGFLIILLFTILIDILVIGNIQWAIDFLNQSDFLYNALYPFFIFSVYFLGLTIILVIYLFVDLFGFKIYSFLNKFFAKSVKNNNPKRFLIDKVAVLIPFHTSGKNQEKRNPAVFSLLVLFLMSISYVILIDQSAYVIHGYLEDGLVIETGGDAFIEINADGFLPQYNDTIGLRDYWLNNSEIPINYIAMIVRMAGIRFALDGYNFISIDNDLYSAEDFNFYVINSTDYFSYYYKWMQNSLVDGNLDEVFHELVEERSVLVPKIYADQFGLGRGDSLCIFIQDPRGLKPNQTIDFKIAGIYDGLPIFGRRDHDIDFIFDMKWFNSPGTFSPSISSAVLIVNYDLSDKWNVSLSDIIWGGENKNSIIDGLFSPILYDMIKENNRNIMDSLEVQYPNLIFKISKYSGLYEDEIYSYHFYRYRSILLSTIIKITAAITSIIMIFLLYRGRSTRINLMRIKGLNLKSISFILLKEFIIITIIMLLLFPLYYYLSLFYDLTILDLEFKSINMDFPINASLVAHNIIKTNMWVNLLLMAFILGFSFMLIYRKYLLRSNLSSFTKILKLKNHI